MCSAALVLLDILISVFYDRSMLETPHTVRLFLWDSLININRTAHVPSYITIVFYKTVMFFFQKYVL